MVNFDLESENFMKDFEKFEQFLMNSKSGVPDPKSIIRYESRSWNGKSGISDPDPWIQNLVSGSGSRFYLWTADCQH